MLDTPFDSMWIVTDSLQSKNEQLFVQCYYTKQTFACQEKNYYVGKMLYFSKNMFLLYDQKYWRENLFVSSNNYDSRLIFCLLLLIGLFRFGNIFQKILIKPFVFSKCLFWKTIIFVLFSNFQCLNPIVVYAHGLVIF